MKDNQFPQCPAYDLSCPYLQVKTGCCTLEDADQECEFMMGDLEDDE